MITLDNPPTPRELFDSPAGALPLSWRSVKSVGALVNAGKDPVMLDVVAPGAVFCHPGNFWHKIAVKTISALPRPGDGSKRHLRFWSPDRIQFIDDENGQRFPVTVLPEWDTPESYEAAHPQPFEAPFEFSDDEGWARLKAALRVADSVG